jgi:hypothetical protein
LQEQQTTARSERYAQAHAKHSDHVCVGIEGGVDQDLDVWRDGDHRGELEALVDLHGVLVRQVRSEGRCGWASPVEPEAEEVVGAEVDPEADAGRPLPQGPTLVCVADTDEGLPGLAEKLAVRQGDTPAGRSPGLGARLRMPGRDMQGVGEGPLQRQTPAKFEVGEKLPGVEERFQAVARVARIAIGVGDTGGEL